ncbi:unnamed protein product, partial [Larinioides sclopetarius]
FLKYEDTVYYTENAYEQYKTRLFPIIREENGLEEISKPENQISKSRLYRILQIIFIFLHHKYYHYYRELFDLPDTLEALRLVWRSIRDSFVSLQEMNDAYGHFFPTEILSEAHSFYEETIHQTVSCRKPQSLTQYCKCVIRKSLYNSKQWLPNGIKHLNLPPRFKSFLNLERDHLRPQNFQAH